MSMVPLRLAIDLLRTEMYSKSSPLQSLITWSTKASKSYLNACVATQPSAEYSAWGVGAWPLGSFAKISVLKLDTRTHCIVRSTEKQCAAWPSRVLGRATDWVIPHYRVNKWMFAVRSGSSSTFPTCGQHFSCRKKLQEPNFSACDLKDKSKAFIPWSPHPAAACGQCTEAAPFLQLAQRSRNADYCETGPFWVAWTI